MSSNIPTQFVPNDEARMRDAFDATQGERDGLKPSELMAVNLDVEVATTVVRGALPHISIHRGSLALLPGFNLARIDRLERYVLAAGHAHARYQAVGSPSVPVTEIAARVMTIRQRLYADATVLADRKIIDGARLAELKGPATYQAAAYDVISLVGVFHESWAAIAGKTAVTEAELAEAQRLADGLLNALGARDHAPAETPKAADDRQRAVTLLVLAWNELRRGLSYTRGNEGDVDAIAPSLYKREPSRKAEVAPEAPANGSAPSRDGIVAPPDPVVRPGFPGGSPFTDE